MEQNHIINKVVVEISVSNKKKASEIKDNISSFLAMDVFPKLEKHFNTTQAVLQSHTLQISRLTVNVEESQSSLNSVLKNSIIDSFEKELAETIKPEVMKQETKKGSDINLLSESEKLLHTFIHFIEKGYMPWWHSNEKPAIVLEDEVFKKIVSNTAFVPKIVHCMRKPKVQQRIINQFTDSQIKQICLIIIKAKNVKMALNNALIKQLSGQTLEDRKVFWSLILHVLTASFSGNSLEEYIAKEAIGTILKISKKQGDEEHILKHIQALFPFIKQSDNFHAFRNKNSKALKKEDGEGDKNQKKEISTAEKKLANLDPQENEKIDEINGLHVPNAGLVLIHPFINNLFRHCNLIDTETKKLTDPEVCAHLLHYIATGKTNQPESNMLFEKFLCNIPIHQSINRHVKLSRKHKSEAAKVIAAVQQNWSSVKTASVGLIQNEFFQRPGKLIIDNNQTLTVERKTQDILLDKLSWGIGFIKLPWQTQFIYVNW